MFFLICLEVLHLSEQVNFRFMLCVWVFAFQYLRMGIIVLFVCVSCISILLYLCICLVCICVFLGGCRPGRLRDRGRRCAGEVF